MSARESWIAHTINTLNRLLFGGRNTPSAYSCQPYQAEEGACHINSVDGITVETFPVANSFSSVPGVASFSGINLFRETHSSVIEGLWETFQVYRLEPSMQTTFTFLFLLNLLQCFWVSRYVELRNSSSLTRKPLFQRFLGFGYHRLPGLFLLPRYFSSEKWYPNT